VSRTYSQLNSCPHALMIYSYRYLVRPNICSSTPKYLVIFLSRFSLSCLHPTRERAARWCARQVIFQGGKESEAFRINYCCLDKSVCKWRVLATPSSDSDSSDGFLIRDGLSALDMYGHELRTKGANYQQADMASA
jgi:hypothetical protein